MMKFKAIVALFLLIAGGTQNTFSSGKKKSEKKPNIIYLFSDEHRYQSISFTETPEVKTPNMDRLAHEGVSFRNAISNNPVCCPYRSMLLSGQWCYSTGMVENNGTLASWDLTLGNVFKSAGYITGYTGKWHAGKYPELAGFNWHMHWDETNNHWNSIWTDLHGTGNTFRCTVYNPVKMTDQALDFIEKAGKSTSPFFLMVSWNPPHAIFTDPPEEMKSLYPSSEQLPWRENADENSKAKWWKSYQGYHAHITAIDGQIGRILKKLEQLGIEENTIIIYSSDHGSMMNSHGKSNKRHPYEESIRVPFLVRYPDAIKPGQVRDELFGSIDIFPTLCGLAGIDVPSFCGGQDFSPTMFGKKGPDPESQFIMHIGWAGKQDDIDNFHTPFFRGVRGKRYTYTVNTNGPWQLFDNNRDPFQENNLINDLAYAKARENMQKELDQWIKKAEDPFIHNDYHTMPLKDRIARQALFFNKKSQQLKEFTSRLKLSPEQESRLETIRYSIYREGEKPLKGNGAKSWEDADKTLRKKIKSILTPDQLQRFTELEVLENSLVNKK